MSKITDTRRFAAERNQTGRDGKRAPEVPSLHNNALPSHNLSATNKDTRATPIHGGCAPQPPGGRGHASGAAPGVDDGGQPVATGIHPFAKPPSLQLSHGKLAPIHSGMVGHECNILGGGGPEGAAAILAE